MPTPDGSPQEMRERYERLAGGDELPPHTVAGLVERFVTRAEARYKRRRGMSDEITNFRDALRPLLAIYSMESPSRIGPRQLAACREMMLDSGLARTTINSRVSKIRRMFSWSVSQGWTTPEQLTGLQTLDALRSGQTRAPEPELVKPVSVEVFEATVPCLPVPVAAMARLQLLTAMRPGEVVNMTGQEIAGDRYTPAEHKNAHRGQTRTVYLGPRAMEIIADWMRHGHLFLTRYGKPYTVNGYGIMVRKGCDRAGVERWSPNRLRHTAATLFREQFGLEVAAAVLGHADPSVTSIYAERHEAAAMEAVKEMG